MKVIWVNLLTVLVVISSPCLMAFTPKIVLLTSLDPETNRPPFRSKSWDINKKLEESFRHYLERYNIELDPVVIHFADQLSLYQKLTSEEVRAVIWVSHAGFKQRQGIQQATSIIDYKGRDLKGVFQALGSSVKFLGLVGCQGQGFLDEWKSNGWPYSGHRLESFSREKRTDARKGLKLALKSLGKNFEINRANYLQEKVELNNSHDRPRERSEDLSIELKRINVESTEMKSVQVFQKKRLITVLPASKINQVLSIKVRVTPNSKESDLKIVLDSGENSLSNAPNLGRLEFNSPFENHWKIFSTPDGVPFGVGTNIYTNVISLITNTP